MSDYEMDQFSSMWGGLAPKSWREEERKERARHLVDSSYSVSTLLQAIPARLRNIKIECAVSELPAMCRWLALIEEDGHPLPDSLRIEVEFQAVLIAAVSSGFQACATVSTSSYKRYWPVFESAAAGVLEALKCRGGEIRLIGGQASE